MKSTPKISKRKTASLSSHPLALELGRRHWLSSQGLDRDAPFGSGRDATRAAIEHLGYVQIDTINVIERCHHHILQTRIPDYRREHLHHAQAQDKSVFEYWTHALSYVPTRDLRYFRRAMKHDWQQRTRWYAAVTDAELRKVLRRIKSDGALTIRDIDDDILIEKEHEWQSRKPSKRALQLAFYRGLVVISQRTGMLKTYELTERHFGWEVSPPVASETDVLNYMLDRALRAQGVVSLDSICHLEARRKPGIQKLIDARVRSKELVPVHFDGAAALQHWVRPEILEAPSHETPPLVRILSPFDPLIIQRKRLQHFFRYEHRFEAYVPKEKRQFGYFALPVLMGDEIVAVLDLKTDRAERKLKIQQWSWVARRGRAEIKRQIETSLAAFEQFQLAS